MLPIHSRIDRAQRLIRMLEEDTGRLAIRVAELTPEPQQSAKNYAASITTRAHAELAKLMEEKYFWEWTDAAPHGAD